MTELKDRIKEINDLLNQLTEINDLLNLYNEVSVLNKSIDDISERIKIKVKIYLKERKWDRYMDEKTKMSVNIIPMSRTSYNDELLKKMLTNNEYSQAVKITTYERMQIVTDAIRKNFKKMI